MNKRKLFILIVLIIGIVSTSIYAKDELPESSYEFYIYDEANIINSNVEDYIINTNKFIYENTGAQIVVATVNSLGNMDKKSYATALYEKWKIGSKEYDNGMLILIIPEEGEIWIEVGYGLEGRFPDSLTKRIIEDYMIPYFQEDRYSEGVLAGFNEILSGLEKEYNINFDSKEEINNPIPIDSVSASGSPIPKILMIIGIIIFLIIDFSFFRGMITYSLLRSIGRGSRGGRGGGSSGGGGRSGGGGAGGKW